MVEKLSKEEISIDGFELFKCKKCDDYIPLIIEKNEAMNIIYQLKEHFQIEDWEYEEYLEDTK